jgi:beta-lactamase regulating signal transducer with metallopeptidase domain
MNGDWEGAALAIWRDGMLRASVQAAGTILILLAIERLVPWLGARWRSWLWRFVYVKMAIVVCLPIAWQVPVVPDLLGMNRAPVSTETVVESIADSTDAQVASATMAAGSPAAGARWSWWTVICGAWAVCVFAQVMILIGQWRQVQRLAASASRSDPQLLRLLKRVGREMGIAEVPEVLTVSGISSPMVIGVFRPRILWPQSFGADAASAEDQRMALAHELGHIVRHDLAWNLLVAALHAVLCFHPLIWLAGRRYLVAQESACDELAMRRAGLDRVRFAELLIRISQRPRLRTWNPAGVPLIPGRGIHFLRERLNNMQRSRLSRSRQMIAALALSLGIGTTLLPWSLGFAQSKPENSTVRNKKTEKGSTTRSETKTETKSFQSGGSIGTSGGAAGGSSFSSGSGSATGGARTSGGGSGFATGSSGGKAGGIAGGSGTGFGSDLGGGGISISNVRGSTTQSSETSNGTRVTTSCEMNDDGEEIRVTVQEKTRDIQLRQTDADGIDVFIRPTKKNGDQTVIQVAAATADELKTKNPQAYEVYQKYLGSKLKQIRAGENQAGGAAAAGNGANSAQQLMKQHLQELLNNEDLPAPNRAQIQKMLEELP